MKKQHLKYLWGAIALVVLIVLAFVFANALAGWLSAVLGGPGALKLMQQYLAVEKEQQAANQKAEKDRRRELARILAAEKELEVEIERRKRIDSQELDLKMQEIKTDKDADTAIVETLSDHDKFLRENGGFAVSAILAALCILGFFAVILGSCPAQADTPITPQAKERTRKIIDTLNRYRRLVVKLKARHKLELRKLRANMAADHARARNDLAACRAKKQIIATKPSPPTWPYLLAGAGVGALIVGGVWIGAAIAQRGK